MDRIAAALGDATRRRIVELLAERPRSAGELAELNGSRQPQPTKRLRLDHLAAIIDATGPTGAVQTEEEGAQQ